ncbi:AlkA N-terminal domain-containing protein [Nonomuraea antimicrobica]|uniref:AlkA N-terminal domain-containing protein n=2 Tax=Nonomuraea antimicrobica TaxID=561173 RepID=A0ABP7D1Z0_9ACTN
MAAAGAGCLAGIGRRPSPSDARQIAPPRHGTLEAMISAETARAAMESRDPRFDGWFYVAVTTTGIYCRPSCPAVMPKPQNMRLYPSAAAAQVDGFRACRRCRPDLAPGSPAWNARADLVGRAVRLIADGVVDREGVAGLAARLGYSVRQVHRQLVAEVGAGPQALARAHRVQTARLLLENTDLPVADIAFAAGFASIRQFNDTIRQLCGATPTRLRGRPAGGPGAIVLRLAYRPVLDVPAVLAYLGARALPGIEEYDGTTYRRSLALPHGAGVAALRDGAGHVACELHLDDLRDLSAAVQRCRRMLDLDADRLAIAETLPPWAATAIPGHPDPDELVVRMMLGRRSRTARARLAALVRERGKPLTTPMGSITHTFPPTPFTVGRDADREEARRRLGEIPGIGRWTIGYVLVRGFGDPDVYIPDLTARRALHRLGGGDPERWRPWRSYATVGLWLAEASGEPRLG